MITITATIIKSVLTMIKMAAVPINDENNTCPEMFLKRAAWKLLKEFWLKPFWIKFNSVKDTFTGISGNQQKRYSLENPRTIAFVKKNKTDVCSNYSRFPYIIRIFIYTNIFISILIIYNCISIWSFYETRTEV